MQSGSLSPILERHTPQYPLPEEIEKMGEEGTVCQFCGVSYLIHREIKKLEDKVEELQKVVEKGKEARRNELLLKEQLEKSNEYQKSLSSKLSQKELVVKELERDIESLSQKLSSLKQDQKDSEKQLESFKSVHQEFKNKVILRTQGFKSGLQLMRDELTELKSTFKPMQDEFNSLCDTARDKMVKELSKSLTENINFQNAAEKFQEELNTKIKSEEMLQATIKLMENELKNAANEKDEICNRFKKENKLLQDQIPTFQNRNSELLQEVAKLQSQLSLSKSDSAQMKEAFSRKQQEAQSALQKLHKVENDSEITIRRLNQEIKILEDDVKVLNTEKEKLKHNEKYLLAQEEKLRTLVNSSTGESQQMTEHMENLKKELQALKHERGQMVISHQSQISQLRETFTEKLKKANGDPDVLEENIRILKRSHKQEMVELESHLKERFDIELALQQEKHEEELKNCVSKFKEMAEDDSFEWRKQAESLMDESRVFQKQISSMKTDYSQRMEEQEKEKKDLKDLIARLENKITSLTGEQQDEAITLHVELRETKRKLNEALEEKTQLEHDSLTLSKEISVLQETVRRECEERFELTEALSQIQEHIKSGKSSDVTPLRTPVSAINRVSHQASIVNQNHENRSGQRAFIPNGFQRHVNGNSMDSVLQRNGDQSPHVKDIMFSNNTNSSLGQKMSTAKSEELAENARRRIAAAIKRK